MHGFTTAFACSSICPTVVSFHWTGHVCEPGIPPSPKHVTGLIKQLKLSKLAGMDHITLVETAATTHLRGERRIQREAPRRLKGQGGKELRWKVEINRAKRGGGGGPVGRDEIARFGRQVELDSRGILKVIDIDLRRAHGEGTTKPGTKAEIRDDKYTGFIVVGMRVVD